VTANLQHLNRTLFSQGLPGSSATGEIRPCGCPVTSRSMPTGFWCAARATASSGVIH